MADVSKLYQKASDYLKRKNYDPAIDLFKQVLAMNPDYAPARRDIRKAEIEKFELQGYPPQFLSSLFNVPGYISLVIAGLTKNHDRYIMTCEEILSRDPRNVPVGIKLGRSLWKAGHIKSALAAFEAILDWDPTNINALVACGDLSRDLDDLEAAIQYFSRAQKTDAKNKHVTDSIRDISAMMSIKPREEASSYRDLVHEEVDLEEEKPRNIDDQIVEARVLTQDNPKDGDAWFQYAELLERKGKGPDAVKSMDKAVALCPDNNDYRIRLGDMKIALLDRRLSAIERKQREKPNDPELAAKHTETERQKTAIEVKEYAFRIKLYPTDLGLRFLLGHALFQTGRIEEAIASFQQSKKDPKRGRESAFWLGRCFFEGKKYKLAVHQFESALEQGPSLDFRGKETHYYLGKARLEEGDPEKALLHFETIYEEDIHFKDVAHLLEEMG
jgi:tetratricopeptide (TPR) repeat protein